MKVSEIEQKNSLANVYLISVLVKVYFKTQTLTGSDIGIALRTGQVSNKKFDFTFLIIALFLILIFNL